MQKNTAYKEHTFIHHRFNMLSDFVIFVLNLFKRNKLGVVAHACHPCTLGAQGWGSLELGSLKLAWPI